MPLIKYDEVYSRLYTKVQAYDLIDSALSDEQREGIMCNWLHGAVHYPYYRGLFSQLSMDDEAKEITYELKYSIDEETDKEFLLDLFSYGMALEWVEPKVNNITNISQMFGSSDERWFSQATHLAEIRNLRDDFELKMRSMVRDRGYQYNDYLDGKAASATMRNS